MSAVEPLGALDRLERLLHREHNAILLGHRDLMTLPVEERVERGDTLAGLKFVGEAPGGQIQLGCTENFAKHRPGDSLRLGNVEAIEGGHGLGVTYVSFDDRTGTIVVARDPWRTDGGFDPRLPLQLDPEAQSLTDLALEALARVRAARGPQAIVREMLEGSVSCRADARAAKEASALAARIAPPFDPRSASHSSLRSRRPPWR